MNPTDFLPTQFPSSTRRNWLTATAVATAALACRVPSFAAPRPVSTDDGVSRSAEAIHQEVVFKASPSRIYKALTDPQQFQKMESLIEDMKGLDIVSKPTVISDQAGGAFSLFGAYIGGRQLELIPNQRIVQAWRVMNWPPGIYSIARFELLEQGTGTKLVFDHIGFPAGFADHLASGWKSHYWEPLEKFLAA